MKIQKCVDSLPNEKMKKKMKKNEKNEKKMKKNEKK